MDTTPNEPESTARRRRPFQFRLTDVLLGTAWLAVLLAIVTQVDAHNGRLLLSVIAWTSVPFAFARYRGWMTVGEGIAVFVTIAVIILLLTPGVQSQPRGRRRGACINNMHQIALALSNYEQVYGCLPPEYIADAQGKPMHSWRVLILPFLEQQELYDAYVFDEPWDGPNNKKLHSTPMPLFGCPSDRHDDIGACHTSYVAVVGPGTAWPGATSTNRDMVRDGLSNTILLVEVANSGIHWMEPRDLPVAAVSAGINPTGGTGISSGHPGVVNVAFMDGHCIPLNKTTTANVLNALLTIHGRERVTYDGSDYTILAPAAKPPASP